MGYINSTSGNMEKNQDINNNSVNGTSVDNRRALPSSRVYPSSGHNGRQEDAAEMGPAKASSPGNLQFDLGKIASEAF